VASSPPRASLSGLREGEAGTTHVLSAETSHHLVRVLRLAAGDHVIAFDPASKLEARAVLLDASSSGARVRLDEPPRQAKAIATTELVLVYALAKGDKVDAVVRDATELGATRILLTQTERSVVDLKKGGADKKLERWKRIVDEASRQCGRADPPPIEVLLDWTAALDRAATLTEARFCLDPRAVSPLKDLLAAAVEDHKPLAFAVGPEGGLSADEIELALAKGFLPVTLGPFVLRTETVAAAILGAVRVLS